MSARQLINAQLDHAAVGVGTYIRVKPGKTLPKALDVEVGPSRNKFKDKNGADVVKDWEPWSQEKLTALEDAIKAGTVELVSAENMKADMPEEEPELQPVER